MRAIVLVPVSPRPPGGQGNGHRQASSATPPAAARRGLHSPEDRLAEASGLAEAIDLDVAAPVITLALQQRLQSRDDYAFANRLLAMMRYQFGGHAFQRPQP